MMRFAVISLLLLFTLNTSAQLWVRYHFTPDELVREKLTKPNSGVKILNVSYYGSRHSIAYFNNNTPGFNVKRGLLLTTGYARNVSAPNRTGNSGAPMGYPGDRDLSRLVNNRTNDAAVLTIEFIPYADSVQFSYFFGSEEYPEYVNKGVNDVFAFFIRKSDDMEYQNLAQLKDGTPVTVDNINNRKNSAFYIPNTYFTGYDYQEMQDDPVKSYRAQEFTFDGFTTELVAAAKVEPYVQYELKIAIADVGDDLYDSGVFLEQGSFEAPDFEKLGIHEVEWNLEKVKESFQDKINLSYEQDTLVVTSHIGFEFNKHDISNEYNDFLTHLAKIMKNTRGVLLNINGHTDSVGTNTYNFNLSRKRALSIANFLVNQGVARSRMQTYGFGSTKPIAPDSTETGRAKNRRVEFHIIQSAEKAGF